MAQVSPWQLQELLLLSSILFHNGHKYPLGSGWRCRGICYVLGTLFSGEPAIVDKWTRLRWLWKMGWPRGLSYFFDVSPKCHAAFRASISYPDWELITLLLARKKSLDYQAMANVYAERIRDMERCGKTCQWPILSTEDTKMWGKKFAGQPGLYLVTQSYPRQYAKLVIAGKSY